MDTHIREKLETETEMYIRKTSLTFAFEKTSRQLQAFSWASSLSRLSISFLYKTEKKELLNLQRSYLSLKDSNPSCKFRGSQNIDFWAL